ncbi:hypothetical protein HRJ34_21190 [Rhizorhabdus wittichii]|uniref:Uncharacterized protein n=1 Tax=Rhizorhabdus wittichii TaxID=160791 RepID=A0A975D0T1_9SPHN|nr:hypothetical protein [Rhizorhabdus wittichii]QTH20812.1 hypothetical protein HRJ34_21190 [Rhizorhabdus wittichii]
MFAGTAIRKRKPDTGLLRPYRPKPADFRETYILIGWDGIDEHFHTNWRCIRRWIIEQIAEDEAAGRIHLKAARAAWIRENGRLLSRTGSRRRAKRYCAGRTLTSVSG